MIEYCFHDLKMFTSAKIKEYSPKCNLLSLSLSLSAAQIELVTDANTAQF